MNISRRSFLKLSAIAAGAAALPVSLPAAALAEAVAPKAANEKKPIPGLRLPSGMEGKSAQKLVLGHFITLDEVRPVAEAMTVIDGRIQYIGSKETALSLCDGDTLVMDYSDSYIYPGFLEAHCHTRGAGGSLKGAANLRTGKCLADYVEIMRKYMEDNPDMDSYKGSGFIARDEVPNAAMLDAICPDKQMILISEDGHSVWVNTPMMQAYGVTPERAKEIGTDQMRVDANGQPTGYISENEAIRIVNSIPISKEDRMKYLFAWQEFAFAHGYTGVGEAALTAPDAEAYHELAKMPEWKLRTRAWTYLDEKSATIDEMVENAATIAEQLNSEYIKVVGVKLFMDGVIEAHTGWLIDDYCDQADYHGVARNTKVEPLKEAVVKTCEKGLNIHVHSIGDAASMTILEAIEQGQKETGNYDMRNAVAHLQVIRPEDVRRLADNHVVAVVAPLWVPREPSYSENEKLYLGKERESACYPIQSFRDQGTVIAFHTDFPVSPRMSIPETIHNAIRRYDYSSGPQSSRGESEAISRRDALLGLTRNVAYMWHEEDRLGTLEVGKIANMSIYDTDFMNAPLDKVALAKLVSTVVDGEVVYTPGESQDYDLPTVRDALTMMELGLIEAINDLV